MSNVTWAGPLLDRLIAPEFSSLISFSLPDVAELPNYFGSFFLNNAFRSEFKDKSRPLVFTMVRRLAQATREYRNGADALSKFGSVKPQSNDALTLYLRALTHFEQVIIHCDLAAGLSHAIARCIVSDAPKKYFTMGDDSPEERLRLLCNSFKHFEGAVVEGDRPELGHELIKGIHKRREQ